MFKTLSTVPSVMTFCVFHAAFLDMYSTRDVAIVRYLFNLVYNHRKSSTVLNLKIETAKFVIVSQDLFKGRLSAKIPEFQPGTVL